MTEINQEAEQDVQSASNALLACPFCGETPELSKYFKEDMYQMIHRCKVMGAICLDWSSAERVAKRWNTRAY
jgi:hypothetical protein